MVPHPIPYQGSKRNLAPIIGAYTPIDVSTWYEPFAGSAAMTLWTVVHRAPRRIVLGESLQAMSALWMEIIAKPEQVARRYRETWLGQTSGDIGYFNMVRARYNETRDPIDLLYLTCRCLKNAVRFNSKGMFTQAVDKRRLGMKPDKMETALLRASFLLKGRTEVRTGDWLETTSDAQNADYIYMDPPYLGTSEGRDKRYAEWMSRDRLVGGLRLLKARGIRFALSYDGQCGERTYGPPLPGDLGMTHLLIHAGRSSQATLNGKAAETYESLYLSHGFSVAQIPAMPKQKSELSFLDLAAA